MSGARNYMALVVKFPEGHEAQLPLGGMEPQEFHFSECVVEAAAVGRSTDDALRFMTEHLEPEGEDNAQRALDVAVRLVREVAASVAQDGSHTRLVQRFADVLAETPEFGRGAKPTPADDLDERLGAVEESLADVKALAQLLAERSGPLGPAFGPLGAEGPAEPSQAPVVERESGSWIETTEREPVPLERLLVVRIRSSVHVVALARSKDTRDEYVRGFERCREFIAREVDDDVVRDVAAYRAEDLGGEQASLQVVRDLQRLPSGEVLSFLTAAREAIRAKRAGEGS